MMFRRKKKKIEEEIIEDSEVIKAEEKVEETPQSEENLQNEETADTVELEQEVITDNEEVVTEEEQKEENELPDIETSIAISKDLMDEKGIDVVKVEQENTVVEDGTIEIKTRISTKNYDEAVVKLINEVKIFSDEDADLGIQPKRRIWPIILIIIILLGLAGGLYYYFYIYEDNNVKSEKTQEEEEQKDKIIYRYEEQEDAIIFYGDNEVIDTYECDECKAYSLGTYEYFSTNPTLLAIQQDKEIFLYDYTLKQVVSDKYSQLKNLKSDDKTVAFIVTNKEGLSGVIDIHGKVIVPLEYDELGYSKSAGEVSDYTYEENMITASKDGYWGIINFNGEEVIPFEYEDIYYNGHDAVVVCVEGLWYLNDLNNKRLIETGYDIIIPVNSYVFASTNNIFYVLNYKGESIITKEVPTYLNTFRSRENPLTPAFKIEEEGTIVKIYIMSTDTTYDEYKFNTVNGELTEIIQ